MWLFEIQFLLGHSFNNIFPFLFLCSGNDDLYKLNSSYSDKFGDTVPVKEARTVYFKVRVIILNPWKKMLLIFVCVSYNGSQVCF